MTQKAPITIVGGGLGGLGAANALKAFGIAAEVYEAARMDGNSRRHLCALSLKASRTIS